MRPIKFRAWHAESKEIVCFSNEKLCNDEYQRLHLANLMTGNYGDVLMQFTGLQDSEGVDIYEGDVFLPLYNRLPKLAVIYKNGKFNISNFCHAKCKVIGNIHQNPELLGLNK